MLKKFIVLLSAQWQSTFAYPGMLLVWMVHVFFVPFVMLLVWLGIATSNPSIQEQSNQITNYYILLPLVTMFTSAWHGVFVVQKIRTGQLNFILTKPLPYVLIQIANNIAEKITKLIFLVPFVLLTWLLFSVRSTLSIQDIPVIITTISLSALLYFSIQTCVGYVGFWLEDVSGILNFITISDYTIGGRFIPYFLLPPTIQTLTQYLPFRYLHAFPAEVLSNSLTSKELNIGITMQAIWLLVFLIIAIALWKKGIKRYGAVGG